MMLIVLLTSVLVGYFTALCIWKDPYSAIAMAAVSFGIPILG